MDKTSQSIADEWTGVMNEDRRNHILYPDTPADYYTYAAACIAANIKIVSYRLAFECKSHMDFDTVFEFQYKDSRGNYVWGRTMMMVMLCPSAPGHDYPYDGAILREIYKAVRRLRKKVEGNDQGNYVYLVED